MSAAQEVRPEADVLSATSLNQFEGCNMLRTHRLDERRRLIPRLSELVGDHQVVVALKELLHCHDSMAWSSSLEAPQPTEFASS